MRFDVQCFEQDDRASYFVSFLALRGNRVCEEVYARVVIRNSNKCM